MSLDFLKSPVFMRVCAGCANGNEATGFDDTALKSAANPFYTTEKKSDTGQHLGLGLNICKILCERHNGNIILSNDIEAGASVTARFGMIE